MFYTNSIKMLKLFYLHNAQRPNLLRSLALGYSHILSRSYSSPLIGHKVFRCSAGLRRAQSTSVKVQPQVEIGFGHQTSPDLVAIARQAEVLLGSERFSVENSMSYNFGDFRDIVTLFLFKAAHIDHPLLHLAKIVESEPSQTLDGTGQNPYVLWRSMMVVLATESYSQTQPMIDASYEKQKIAMDRISRMSKIVEISHATQQIHKRIVDISAVTDQNSQLTTAEHQNYIENLHKANKAATLIGDLLWTQKCLHMAALNSNIATGLICQFLMEYCESEFVFGVNTVKAEQFNHDAWIQKCQLGIGSLMGNSMSIMFLFCGHEDEAMRNRGFKLGSLMGLTYQAFDDIKYFERNELGQPTWLDVGMLPVVYKIQSDPQLLNKPYNEVFRKVKEDGNNMEQAKSTFRTLQAETLKCLEEMKPYETSAEAGYILTRFLQSLEV